MPKPSDPLSQWLALTWERPERSYNPNVRDFFAGLLGYPKNKVVTEDRTASGFSDVKLVTEEGTAWVVGDLKKDDNELLVEDRRKALWADKRKYVEGLTRYVLFLTPHYFWIVTPDGKPLKALNDEPIAGLETPFDLRTLNYEELQARLDFLRYETASHARQWSEFVQGELPYVYLTLDNPDSLRQLRGDLRAGFQELTDAATGTMRALEAEYRDYETQREQIDRDLAFDPRIHSRASLRLELKYRFVRSLFRESVSQFEEQYGRDIEASKPQEQAKRVREAFVADSAAALIARVLFLRLVEDLNIEPRRLSNGGPKDWAKFVKHLTGNALSLVRLVSEDMERVYREPFAPTVFDWIHRADATLDIALQRLIVRLNAYNFAGLSEEILGDIYQQFLPPQKRKQLGEFYTPSSIVEWILDKTVRAHGLGTILDPACGSGSFLVRYAHWRLEDARQRGFDVAQVGRELQKEVWGFDLNPFAAFISLFQLLWALLRFDPEGQSEGQTLSIEVHNLNSLLSDRQVAVLIGEENLPAGAMARDEKKWKYVVGNPPYIRAERVKYGEEMRNDWAAVWGKNSDTGLIMLYRALTEWLEPGGWFGMVVSGGYANSEAAGKVWHLVHLGQKAALRKIVWMEYVEANGKPVALWDAARVPMILIIERVAPKEEDEIDIYVPNHWPSDEPPTKVKYADFFDPRVNPRVSNGIATHGDYLIPLLEQGDVPLLQKLNPNGNGSGYQPLGNLVKWTYGVQRGGVDVMASPTGTRPIQVIAGRSLAVAWGGEPAGWVDLDAVAKRPFGKLSLWRQERNRETATIQVAEIILAPSASVDGDHAALNTIVVGEAASLTRAKAIAACINSKMVRFYWALKLRAGVIQGYYAHVYPRTLEALPWPKTMTTKTEEALAKGYDRLAELAQRAKNNPNEWLLSETEQRLRAGHLRIIEPSLGLRFLEAGVEATVEELVWSGNRVEPLAEFANDALAEYVFHLLTLTVEEETRIKAAEVQKLLVPNDYAALLAEYHRRMDSFRQVEQDFMAALEDVDKAVYVAFGMTAEEQDYITARLSRFPLNRLQPRYPWQTVRPRPIKAYMEDRFQ